MAQSNEITSYFQVKKTIEFVNVPVFNDESQSESFYKNCLHEKIECSPNCEQRKIELKKRLKDEQDKLSSLQKALSSCQFIINLKNEKIDAIMKQNGPEETSAAAHTPLQLTKSPKSPPHLTKSPTPAPIEIFKGHERDFTGIQLAQLRSFGKELRYDSSFILHVMRYLYADDITVVKGISVTGASKKDDNKTQMSSAKYAVINSIFEERLRSLSLSHTEKQTRSKRLNMLLKSAIVNITKQAKQTENTLSIGPPHTEQQ